MIYPDPLPEPFTDADTRMWYLIFYNVLQRDGAPVSFVGEMPFTINGEEGVMLVHDGGELFDQRPQTRGWPMGQRAIEYSVEGLFSFTATFDTSQNKYHQDRFIRTSLDLAEGVSIEDVQHHMMVWKLMSPWAHA